MKIFDINDDKVINISNILIEYKTTQYRDYIPLPGSRQRDIVTSATLTLNDQNSIFWLSDWYRLTNYQINGYRSLKSLVVKNIHIEEKNMMLYNCYISSHSYDYNSNETKAIMEIDSMEYYVDKSLYRDFKINQILN